MRKIIIIGNCVCSGLRLTDKFKEAGWITMFVDARNLSVNHVLDLVHDNKADLVICYRDWRRRPHGEGLQVMQKLHGECPFLLTSRMRPDKLAETTAKIYRENGYFIPSRHASGEALVELGGLYAKNHKLSRRMINTFIQRAA